MRVLFILACLVAVASARSFFGFKWGKKEEAPKGEEVKVEIDCDLSEFKLEIETAKAKCLAPKPTPKPTRWWRFRPAVVDPRPRWADKPAVCMLGLANVVSGRGGLTFINFGNLRAFFVRVKLETPYDQCVEKELSDFKGPLAFIHRMFFTEGELDRLEEKFEELTECIAEKTKEICTVEESSGDDEESSADDEEIVVDCEEGEEEEEEEAEEEEVEEEEAEEEEAEEEEAEEEEAEEEEAEEEEAEEEEAEEEEEEEAEEEEEEEETADEVDPYLSAVSSTISYIGDTYAERLENEAGITTVQGVLCKYLASEDCGIDFAADYLKAVLRFRIDYAGKVKDQMVSYCNTNDCSAITCPTVDCANL